jgi:hypothetical protein
VTFLTVSFDYKCLIQQCNIPLLLIGLLKLPEIFIATLGNETSDQLGKHLKNSSSRRSNKIMKE